MHQTKSVRIFNSIKNLTANITCKLYNIITKTRFPIPFIGGKQNKLLQSTADTCCK